MRKDNDKKKVPPFIIILFWLLFLGCTAVIAYLSFQNGEDAKELGSSVTLKLAQWNFQLEDVPEAALTGFTYKLRQLGRLIIFFILGVFGTSAVHLTFRKIPWFFRALISVVILLAVAVVTERMKIYLPTRHYSAAEMLISIIGAMLGLCFVSFVTLFAVMVQTIRQRSES